MPPKDISFSFKFRDNEITSPNKNGFFIAGGTTISGGTFSGNTITGAVAPFADISIAAGNTIDPSFLSVTEFNAPDGQTTDIFFLLCCQDDRSHLHVLARICLMCQQTPLIFNLRVAQTAELMYEALLGAEQTVLQRLTGAE